MRSAPALDCRKANDNSSHVVTANLSQYQPISCEFHDLLEMHASTRKLVQVQVRDETGAIQCHHAFITDVYARNGGEYLSLSTGDTVRLDQLVEVDGVTLANYC